MTFSNIYMTTRCLTSTTNSGNVLMPMKYNRAPYITRLGRRYLLYNKCYKLPGSDIHYIYIYIYNHYNYHT